MAEEIKATEENAEKIATQEAEKVTLDEDLAAKVEALEKEKAKIAEEKENYRIAYLKEHSKKSDDDESEDDRLRRIAREELANSRLADIAREQDAIIKKALKENTELKRAVVNRPTSTPTSGGSSTEGQAVKDTSITDDQLSYFKNVLKWDDKKIENYKKNLRRYSGR